MTDLNNDFGSELNRRSQHTKVFEKNPIKYYDFKKKCPKRMILYFCLLNDFLFVDWNYC